MDKKTVTLSILAFAVSFAVFLNNATAADVLIIGHPSLPKLDRMTIEKLFTGRIIEIAGQPATVVNAVPGSLTRQQFLTTFLAQDEDKYRAYWTVRRFIGKGTPPKELASSREIIDFVMSQPGGIGYISASERTPQLNVLIER